MASAQDLNAFLQGVQNRAFKRVLFSLRDEDAALDVVQDSMIKLATHYGDAPAPELPFLFARILRTTMLDALRRRKTRFSFHINFSELLGKNPEGSDNDPLDILAELDSREAGDSPEQELGRKQTLAALEHEIEKLPERQREAFLLRYWEEMSVEETASIMGCSTGSVKTHCSRAVHALGQAARLLGLRQP